MRSRRKQKGGSKQEGSKQEGSKQEGSKQEENVKEVIQNCINQRCKQLDLSSLDLIDIPSDPPLPDTLTSVVFTNNKLTTLPSLPSRLTHLFCGANKLTSLPDLPQPLKEIYCSENNLETLPKLHNNLKVLSSTNNKLTHLPTLPHNLTHLYLSYNKLKYISKLPNTLMFLICSHNKLTRLPEIPDNLLELYCEDNNLPDELYQREEENMDDYIKRLRPIVKIMNMPSNENKNKKRVALGELRALPIGNNIGIESFPGGINYLKGKEHFIGTGGQRSKTKKIKSGGGVYSIKYIDDYFNNPEQDLYIYTNERLHTELTKDYSVEANSICYMVNERRTPIIKQLPIPLELPYANDPDSFLKVGKQYLWVLTLDEPTTIYICPLTPLEIVKALYPHEDVINNKFYPCNHINEPYYEIDNLHHNYLSRGRDVICAGEFTFLKKSKLVITNASGHYKPYFDCLNERAYKLFTYKDYYNYKIEIMEAEDL